MQIALLVVSALVIVMPKLMVDGDKVAGVDLDAHFDPQIVDIINIPRACMANNFAVGWFQELRSFVEAFGKRRETER